MAKTINARLTGYWPFQSGLSAADRLMEGGTNDYLGKPLFTLEAFRRGEASYVSVAGDKTVWPYGQRIEIDAWPDVIFRVVDTGGHFTGAGKLYREPGNEPLDICVDSSKTTVPKFAVVRIIEGDYLPSKRTLTDVNFAGVIGQEPTDTETEEVTADGIDAVTQFIDDDPIAALAIAAVFGIALYFALKG
jgi:hypothetical protein